MRIAFVLWDGRIGGAERSTIALAAALRRQGTETGVVFVGRRAALTQQIEQAGLPAVDLGFSRGHDVLRGARHLRRAVNALRADVVVASSFGYLGASLRAAGFRGALIGVEHGVLGSLERLTPTKRLVRMADRSAGVLVHDAEVAVSQYMHQLAERHIHGRPLVCIPHGVSVPAPDAPPEPDGHLRVGFAGRLVAGKGVDVLLHAAHRLRRRDSPRCLAIRVAGDGPFRAHLEHLARSLGLEASVRFLGWTDDINGFWRSCDVGVAPNDSLSESFCISAAEAMASARPVVVSALGALPELVAGSNCGFVVRPGNVDDLATALESYANRPALVREQGRMARARASERFGLDRCARQYHDLAVNCLTRRS